MIPRHCRCRILMAPNTLSRILSEAVGSCLAGHFVRIDTDSIVKLSSTTDFVYIRCLSSFRRLLSSLCSGKACNYVLAPLPTYMQGNSQSQNDDGNERTADGWGVSNVAHTLAKYVRGVAHTYIARRSSLALPPSTLIIA